MDRQSRRAQFHRNRLARLAADAEAERAASTNSLRNTVFDAVEPYGGPITAGSAAGLADFVPFYGDAVGFEDAADAFGAGDYGLAAVEAGLGTVGLVPGVGDALAAGGKGLLGIFAGAAARTADVGALKRAQDLTEAGATKEDVWRETGWFTGADGQWRFEIDDSGADFDPVDLRDRMEIAEEEGRSYNWREEPSRVEFALSHPELWKAYPEIGEAVLYYPNNSFYREAGLVGARGSAGRRRSDDTLLMSIRDDVALEGDPEGFSLHEAQHLVQSREGFLSGSNPSKVGMDAYLRESGEVEARNVQARRAMTAAERRATPPWATQDVPYDQQIVRLQDGGLAMSAGPGAARGFRAYHGSPHDFDKFSLDHIGTGEGAQAYGDGLYFAENPLVPEFYRRLGQSASLDGQRAVMAKRLLEEFGGRGAALRYARKRMRSTDTPSHIKFWDDVVQNFDELTLGKAPGVAYEVNIDARPEDFLDFNSEWADANPIAREAINSELGHDWHASTNGALQNASYELARREGRFAPIGGLDKRLTEILSDASIPGIRYLDQGSRTAGAGSRNFVVFDDSLIEILRKYGLLGTAAGAGAAGYALSDPYGDDDDLAAYLAATGG